MRKKRDEQVQDDGIRWVLDERAGEPWWVQCTDIPGGLLGRSPEGRPRLYPYAFLRPTGREGYVSATHYYVPSDGNYSHIGDVPQEELVEIPRHAFNVWWDRVCAERSGLNAAAVFEAEEPQGTLAANVAKIVVIVAAVFTLYTVNGLSGRLNEINARVEAAPAAIVKAIPTAPAPVLIESGAQDNGQPKVQR